MLLLFFIFYFAFSPHLRTTKPQAFIFYRLCPLSFFSSVILPKIILPKKKQADKDDLKQADKDDLKGILLRLQVFFINLSSLFFFPGRTLTQT
jgi:hypothetical protein